MHPSNQTHYTKLHTVELTPKPRFAKQLLFSLPAPLKLSKYILQEIIIYLPVI